MILTRRPDDIIITVTSVRGDAVRLGIDAPADVEVDRAEVREEKDRKRKGEHDGNRGGNRR